MIVSMTRAAHLVDRGAGDAFRKSGAERGLASRRLAEAGRQHAAHQTPVDVAGVYTPLAAIAPIAAAPELRGGGAAQGTLKRANRGPFGGDDDYGV